MVFSKIKSILEDQLDLEEDQVTLEADIAEDLGADSLDVVDLVMAIEDEFDIQVPDEKIEEIRTVGDIVKFVESEIN
jgi:acyl carrier protein